FTDIKDSINYAKRLQEAVLPKPIEVKSVFPQSFILFLPRDIVSGDFYWISDRNDVKIFVVADCTGHGVPGAFVSMLGNDLLNQIVNERGITSPSEILIQLNQGVQKAFKSDDLSTNSNDGMDISIVAIKDDKMICAGANRPIFIIRNNELIELKPDKYPIGGRTYFDFKYTNQEIQLKEDDLIYQFTDGYADRSEEHTSELQSR